MPCVLAPMPFSFKLLNYLRTHRKRSSLSQDDVALLLGCRSGAKVSRYEHFVREPSLCTALACEVNFGSPAQEVFGGLYHKVEQEASGRATRLRRKLAI